MIDYGAESAICHYYYPYLLTYITKELVVDTKLSYVSNCPTPRRVLAAIQSL